MKKLVWILQALSVLAYPRPTDDGYVVDLDYAKHAPSWKNTTTHGTTLLNYNNIRYAQPPVGDLRFRKPAFPPPISEGISFGNISASNDQFLPPALEPPPSFPSSWETDCVSSGTIGIPFPLLSGATWGSEDCLLLNVVVPEGTKPGDKLPVLHWTIGSAFAFGSKDWTGFGINTYGLWNRPLGLPDKFIIVTHNYRLGVPGWTPKFDEDMNGNLGVWDSLAAIEWTKKYIDRFGGDPDNITAIGQSARAAILAWLLVARNGTLELPFQQAWIASPTLAPRGTLERSRSVWESTLNYTQCGGVECLRTLSEAEILDLNKHMLIELTPGAGGGSLGPGVGYTPTVDGELLSDLHANLLAQGKINKDIRKLVVGNTKAEGIGLSSDRDMPTRFPEIVRANIPGATDQDVVALQALYPYPPDVPEFLAWDYTTDICWTCNVANIASAYKHIARRQLFAVPPGYHGQDLSYYFYDNVTIPLTTQEDIDVAYASEAMLLQFMFGRDLELPADARFARKLSEWPVLGDGEVYANVTLEGFDFEPVAEHLRQRCGVINTLVRDPAKGV